jgi:hypothetical protein
MTALFLKSYDDKLVESIAAELEGVTTCTLQTVDKEETAKAILDKIREQTVDFAREESRLLVSLAYLIHDVLCDNPDESWGWYTNDKDLAKRILPLIQDLSHLVEFNPR